MKTTVKQMIWLQFFSLALFFISEVNGKWWCPELLLGVKLPPHTKVASKQHINNHVTLVCDKGYYFSKGKSIKDLSCNTLKYLANDRIPQCKGCGLPPGIRNGTVKFPATSVGSVAVYSCDVGFTLKGTRKQRRCTRNLRWSDGQSPITCQKNKCRDPGNIKIRNGKVTFSDRSFKEFSTISFQCNDGYELFGDKNIVCLQGQWSLKRRPICNKKRFPWPNIPENGRLRGTVKHKEGLDLIFVLDTSSNIANKDFQIAKEFVKKIVEIFGVDPRPNGDGTHIACITYATYPRIEFTFNDASVQTKAKALKKIDAIRYKRGATGTRLALEMVRSHILPSSKRPNSTKALFLITDGESNIGGSPWKAAEYLKEKKKVSIYVIGIGRKIRHESLERLASIPLKEHKFEMKSYKKLEKITEKIVVRDYLECGISPFTPHDGRARIVGGDETSRGRWPWVARIYYKGRKVCGGTLINKELILTAAHCFGIGRIERTNVQVLFKKKGGTYVHTSRAVYLHTDYNPYTYANDVALVKIPKLKYYTRYQQRICLPHGVNTAKIIKPGNKMYAVGWGITRRLKPGEHYNIHEESSKVLKQVKLPFQPNKMCADIVKNKTDQGHDYWYFNSTTQFCAGDLTGQNDTCSGDDGGPAMVLLKHPVSSKWRWFQVGVISWGYGCAQLGEVGYYTKVSAFLSNWIDKIAS